MGLGEVFFEGKLVFENFFGDVFADEAEVPGLVVVTSDVFFAFGVAEDKTKHSEFFMNLCEDFAVGDHFVIYAFIIAVWFDNEDVDGESCVMFGVADFCEVFFAIFGSEFGIC